MRVKGGRREGALPCSHIVRRNPNVDGIALGKRARERVTSEAMQQRNAKNLPSTQCYKELHIGAMAIHSQESESQAKTQTYKPFNIIAQLYLH